MEEGIEESKGWRLGNALPLSAMSFLAVMADVRVAVVGEHSHTHKEGNDCCAHDGQANGHCRAGRERG